MYGLNLYKKYSNQDSNKQQPTSRSRSSDTDGHADAIDVDGNNERTSNSTPITKRRLARQGGVKQCIHQNADTDTDILVSSTWTTSCGNINYANNRLLEADKKKNSNETKIIDRVVLVDEDKDKHIMIEKVNDYDDHYDVLVEGEGRSSADYDNQNNNKKPSINIPHPTPCFISAF